MSEVVESKVATLLYSRKIAAAMLNCSDDTLYRLEKSGQLHPIKLSKKRTGQVHYKASEVHKLAGLDVDAA